MTNITESNPLDARYLRQLGIYNPGDREGDHVTFLGVGGIGSFAAFGAAKLGVPKLTLIDPDVCENHNVPNQMFDAYDCDEPLSKVDAMASHIHNATHPVEPEVETYQLRMPDESAPRLSGLVVSGFDSMEARTEVWENCIKLKPAIHRYIDARLSGQFIVVYSVNPSDLSDCQKYEEQTLSYDDTEAEDTLCTERGIIDVGMQVGSLITRLIRRHFNGDDVPSITMMNQESYVTTQGGWVGDD